MPDSAFESAALKYLTWPLGGTLPHRDNCPQRYGQGCECGRDSLATLLYTIKTTTTPEHQWQFYANGTFCTRCGTSIGSGYPCR